MGTRAPRTDDWFDRAVLGFVARVSGRTVAVISLAFYPGIGLALPLIAGWPTSWLISMNLIGVVGAATFSLGWLVVQLEAKDRRQLLEWTTDLRHLTAQEFEWFVGEVFRREGWKVQETGRQDAPDGNVDLVLTRGNERHLVQCKRWQSWQVGANDIRAFAGTMRGTGKADVRGIFVTLSDFTETARQEAKRVDIALIDRQDLHARVERVRRPEPCPLCHEPMVLDRSQHGWWFRCVSQGCSGKRDLTGEPARAIDLLTTRPWLSDGATTDG